MLKRVKINRAKPLVKKRHDPAVAALLLMADIVEKTGRKARGAKQHKAALELAVSYHRLFRDHLFLRITKCVEKAERDYSWDFMKGCYSQAVEVYAVASLAYEKYNDPIMSDALFDMLAKFLFKNYESITEFCKECWNLDADIFKAGTGSHFRNPAEFPDLAAYDKRLSAHYEEKAKEIERIRAKNKPRLLRKVAVGGKSVGASAVRKPLRRPR